MYNADDAMNTLRCMSLCFQFILFIYLSISYIIIIITDYVQKRQSQRLIWQGTGCLGYTQYY